MGIFMWSAGNPAPTFGNARDKQAGMAWEKANLRRRGQVKAAGLSAAGSRETAAVSGQFHMADVERQQIGETRRRAMMEAGGTGRTGTQEAGATGRTERQQIGQTRRRAMMEASRTGQTERQQIGQTRRRAMMEASRTGRTGMMQNRATQKTDEARAGKVYEAEREFMLTPHLNEEGVLPENINTLRLEADLAETRQPGSGSSVLRKGLGKGKTEKVSDWKIYK